MSYLDFDLLIERTGDTYRARVLHSPAGEATATFVSPLSDLERENFLLRLGRPRQGVRRLESAEMELAKKVGARLYQSAFGGEVQSCLQASLYEAGRREQGLRIRLRLSEVPELADLPWEYVYNPSLNRFLVLSTETPIVRYLDIPERIRPLAVRPPIRILAVLSNPGDYAQLDIEREWAKLLQALEPSVRLGRAIVERLGKATLTELRHRLRADEYHILHFIGHGGFERGREEGVLILETEEGRGTRLSGERLGTLLLNQGSLRLVVLNACEGGRASPSDPFAGVAQTLLQQRIPAVVAMQFEITDEAAITFAQEFYSQLAEGRPVDACVAEARRSIYLQGNDLEWGVPVLYMRSADGRIFDMEGEPEPARSPRAERAPVQPPAAPVRVASSPGRALRVVRCAGLTLLLLLGTLAWIWLAWIWSVYSIASQHHRLPGRDAKPRKSPRDMSVAVAPFYGPDGESEKEGQLMAALVEKELVLRLKPYGVEVQGLEPTRQPVRSHDEARRLGRSLNATIVLWGEAFAVRGETEIQPYLTIVSPAAEPAPSVINLLDAHIPTPSRLWTEQDLARESTSAPVRLPAEIPNQIELRRVSAADFGRLVLIAAGAHALSRHNPEEALRFLRQAPRTSEALYFKALALHQLGRNEEAVQSLKEALQSTPRHAQAQSLLGDVLLDEERLPDAAHAYEAAMASEGSYRSSSGFFYGGLLYRPEKFRDSKGESHITFYLVGVDPVTGRVRDRSYLPGLPRLFVHHGSVVQIHYGLPGNTHIIGWSHGAFDRPVFYGEDGFQRRAAFYSGWVLVANFFRPSEFGSAEPFGPLRSRIPNGLPHTLEDLRQALTTAIHQDETQPWHRFWLGNTLWALGHRKEAEQQWRRLFLTPYSGTPYFEFAEMADVFDRFGQPVWSRNAAAAALERRTRIPQPIEYSRGLDVLFNAPLQQALWRSQGGRDLDRAYERLREARAITGVCVDADPIVSAEWARFFRQRGRLRDAERETRRSRAAWAHPLSLPSALVALDYALTASLAMGLWLVAQLSWALAAGCWRVFQLEGPGAEGLRRLTSLLDRDRRPAARITLFVLLGVALTFLILWMYPETLAEPGRWMNDSLRLALLPVLAALLILAPLSLPGTTRRERAAVALATLVLLAAGSFLLESNRRVFALIFLPKGLSDSLGHPDTAEWLDVLWRVHPSRATAYVAAVSHHLAGDKERASELYRSLLPEKRAEANLSALRAGRLIPPFPFKAEELSRALLDVQGGLWIEIIRCFWRPDRGALQPLQGGSLLGTVPILLPLIFVFALAAIEFLVLALWIPARQAQSDPRPANQYAGWVRIASLFLPGVPFLRRGRPFQGGFILAALFLLASSLLRSPEAFPVPGRYLYMTSLNLFPLPFPTPVSPSLMEAFRSDLFACLPGARTYWFLVALAAAAGVVLHLFAVWRELRSLRSRPLTPPASAPPPPAR